MLFPARIKPARHLTAAETDICQIYYSVPTVQPDGGGADDNLKFITGVLLIIFFGFTFVGPFVKQFIDK